jgi:hypothetical protein
MHSDAKENPLEHTPVVFPLRLCVCLGFRVSDARNMNVQCTQSTRKGGRVDDASRFEHGCAFGHRRFESCPFRQSLNQLRGGTRKWQRFSVFQSQTHALVAVGNAPMMSYRSACAVVRGTAKNRSAGNVSVIVSRKRWHNVRRLHADDNHRTEIHHRAASRVV